MTQIISSEAVSEGHPDKICDQVSDAILDAVLAKDPEGLTAIETASTRGLIFVFGEMQTSTYVEIADIVRQTISNIGYNSHNLLLDAKSCGVNIAISKQSQEIRDGVKRSYELRYDQAVDDFDSQGAGDQGIMFGYATNETELCMPMPIALSNALIERLTHIRKSGELQWLRPDAKAQASIVYKNNTPDKIPASIDTIVLSTCHEPSVSQKELKEKVLQYIIAPVVDKFQTKYALEISNIKFYINPSGSFIEGGPGVDAGLTGRKIIADTYGGFVPHGGGAFSGKDPSKVDRSAAYALRHAAKNVGASGLAKKCLIQASYAIGKARPVGVYIDTYGTSKIPEKDLLDIILKTFDFRPAAIIHNLNLKKPIYLKTATLGHFGRENYKESDKHYFSWEDLNKVDILKSYL